MTEKQRLDLERLEKLATRMDALFRVPGTRIRVGLDSLFGLIPGVGDVATLAPAGYVLHRARQMGAPKPMLARMAANAGIDAVIGTIPLIGDLFDVGFKGNLRNVALLRQHLESLPDTPVAPGEDQLGSHHPTLGGSVEAGTAAAVPLDRKAGTRGAGLDTATRPSDDRPRR